MKKFLASGVLLSTLILGGCSSAPDTTDWTSYSQGTAADFGFSLKHPVGLNTSTLSTGAILFSDPQQKGETVFEVRKVYQSAAEAFAEKKKVSGAEEESSVSTADGGMATSLCFSQSSKKSCEYYVDAEKASSYIISDYSDLQIVRTFQVLK